ncbi:MAG: hypothetical protein PHS39_00665 [Atribacterota bacterium]|nr:hypothetical protein [Atribacterota bacterium]
MSEQQYKVETINEKVEKEEIKKEYEKEAIESLLDNKKDIPNKDKNLNNEKTTETDEYEITKKYKDKEDLDIPTFLRKRNKRF